MKKPCSKCNINKPFEQFHMCKKMKDGRKSSCKICRKSTASTRYTENKEKINKKNKDYYNNNKMSFKKRRQKYYIKNKEVISIKCSEWAKNNVAKKNSYAARRRGLKQNATPTWSEKVLIDLVYEKKKWLEGLTGLTYHVDHIIPLNHPDVCGLHVWSNLQILESSLNFSKNNRCYEVEGYFNEHV